jgi:hypothetical protein
VSIILYEHVNFSGDHKHIVERDERNLHTDGWGDRVSSMDVLAGVWQFCQHVDFGGRQITLGPGSYPNIAAQGLANDSLSSVRRVGPPVRRSDTQGIILFQHSTFRGAHKHLVGRDAPNLHGDGWGDRISSIIVVSGRWRICQHINFAGWSVVLGPGIYPSVPDVGIENDSVSSVRRENPGLAVDRMATREAILYEHRDFAGAHRHLINRGERNLHEDGWGDRVSSVQVLSGANWTFHEHINYGGLAIPLGQGSYRWLPDQGFPNDRLSSARANILPVFAIEVDGATTAIANNVASANSVFDQYAIEMLLLGTLGVGADALLDLDQPSCPLGTTTTPTAEEAAIFRVGRERFPADMIAYYVRSTNLGVRGCSTYQAGFPGVVVADTATQWTLAHEIGHVLGLAHRNNTAQLMNNGTAAITANPPTLTNADLTTVRASAFLT